MQVEWIEEEPRMLGFVGAEVPRLRGRIQVLVTVAASPNEAPTDVLFDGKTTSVQAQRSLRSLENAPAGPYAVSMTVGNDTVDFSVSGQTVDNMRALFAGLQEESDQVEATVPEGGEEPAKKTGIGLVGLAAVAVGLGVAIWLLG